MTEFSRACFAGAAAVVLLVSGGCGGGESSLTSPPDVGQGGLTDPTVTSTVPSFAPRNTTLDVAVQGSSYDPGSRAVWALHGDTAFTATKIRTNRTTFVSDKELVANITIAADASPTSYDVVVVTSRGKKGIGIELFAVTLEVIALGVGDGSAALAINDNNQIVGRGGPGSGAFLWQNGVVSDLGALPGMQYGQPEDINASGQVVGTSFNAAGGLRAVLWTPKAGGGYNPPIDLGTLGGSGCEGKAINDDGVIAGNCKLPGDVVSHAVIWDANRQIHDIQTVQGGESFTWGINALGQVVGQWNGPTYQQAFRYSPGTGMELLPGLGGLQGVALDINRLGQTVGWSGSSINDLRATLWDGSTPTALDGSLGSVGLGITDDGRVVGRASSRAFLWTAASGIQLLDLPRGGDFAQAWDINANGWIVGEVSLASGRTFAALWKPK